MSKEHAASINRLKLWLYKCHVTWQAVAQKCGNGCEGKGTGKGKAIPLQAWTGPEGSRKLRLPDFVTTAQDGSRL